MNSRSDFDAKIRLALGLIISIVFLLLLLQLLLPWLLLGGIVGGSYWFWQRQRRQRRQRQAMLNTAFYRLLQRQQGRINILDLAMLTQISGQEARDYLDTQAQIFSAHFEPTVYGDVLYVFKLSEGLERDSLLALPNPAPTED